MASEIVVGIDFGTTYSGVSWAVNGGNKKVNLITDWPMTNVATSNSDKVPTRISYKNGKVHNWGNSVKSSEECFRWFKLLLDPKANKLANQAQAAKTSHNLLGKLNKKADDIAVDYLRLVWQYTKDDIARKQGDNWESIYKLRVVLTVPAIWSAAAKNRTLAIAKGAGLPDDISLVSEPEAAALAVLKEKNDEDASLQVGDTFVVCDAGGGTVDLISYKIIGLDPLQMEECAVGDGDLCGSTYVDAAFEKYIKTIVGEEAFMRIPEKERRRMANDFEFEVKRTYNGDGTAYSVELTGVEDDEDNGIEDDTIQLKPSMLKTVFDHVINQIMNLVEKQIEQAHERGHNVKAILLVGGFGANKYMFKRLKTAHRGSGIQVLQCNGAWSAICRGATMWGLENSSSTPVQRKTVQARIARYSYGFSVATIFDASKGHLPMDRRVFPDGIARAINQMKWILRKGDRVEEGKVLAERLESDIQVGFFDGGTRSFSQELFYCADDTPPSRQTTSVRELCTVAYGIDCNKLWLEKSWKDPSTGQKWRSATFTLAVLLDSATLHFVVFYRDEPVAYTEAKYKEDF